MTAKQEILTLIFLLAIYILPGWAFLSITQLWKKWAPLQRWVIAIGISIAFFPVLFYFSRIIFPNLHLGRNKLIVLFVILIAIIVFFQHKTWKSQFSFDGLETLAISIFAATIFTRLFLAVKYPYPAWSDSLHHTLLTQLTAANGQLPYTLDPYEPVQLNMYHLGLYALSGSLQILTGIPSHSALLWTAQFLNGLCGLSVYLILDRFIGRKAGIIGAIVVGFYSIQPNYYINWGRFTQLASQTILLIAWLVTWEAIKTWKEKCGFRKIINWYLMIAAGLLNAGVFLLHFRVAGYYLPLLLLTVIYEIWNSIKGHLLSRSVKTIAIVGIGSILLVSPAIVSSVKVYVQRTQPSLESSNSIENQNANNLYYPYSINDFFLIGASKWMSIATLIALVICFVKYPKITGLLSFWMVSLWIEGNAYRLKIPLLQFTNFTAIMIMFYLPMGLLLGMAGEVILHHKWFTKDRYLALFMGIILFGGFVGSHYRMSDIDQYRFFVTADDIQAMDWIRKNTPNDAVFAINTYMWLGNSPHGTDGGYWIPYFTGRKTTTGTMMYGLGTLEYINKIKNLSSLVVNSISNPESIKQLYKAGVKYIYIGSNGNYLEPELDPDTILSYPGAEVVYSKGQVKIIELEQ